ncbi:AMP-binding protein [Embleya scabrispora]|uniref:AMP-binding protein n=1 Tax=Embleya scabrispora TaxID=159449 RepID=UPI000D1C7DA7|nr:AMP-binding protein [Embleya scabrispora]
MSRVVAILRASTESPQYRPTPVDPYRDHLRRRREEHPTGRVRQLRKEILAPGLSSGRLRYHRPTQGRRTHPRQPHPERADLPQAVQRGRARRPLVTLPLFHSFGQTVQLNAGLAARATPVLMPRFDAEGALSLMRRHRVTIFAGVPTMYWALLGPSSTSTDAETDADAVARHLRIAVSGGAALPVEIHHRFTGRFHITIREGYGLSETRPVATFTPMGTTAGPGVHGQARLGCGSRPARLRLDPVRPDRVGENAVRGHNVKRGYHGSPEATAEVVRDGWFRTGDPARRDEDGWLYIVDRTKDLIIRGGSNEYPREIEEVLHSHPDVGMAVGVGTARTPRRGGTEAFVLRAPGAKVTEEDPVAWSRDTMAAHTYPRPVEFRDALPMHATGKILERELRGEFATPAPR